MSLSSDSEDEPSKSLAVARRRLRLSLRGIWGCVGIVKSGVGLGSLPGATGEKNEIVALPPAQWFSTENRFVMADLCCFGIRCVKNVGFLKTK